MSKENFKVVKYSTQSERLQSIMETLNLKATDIVSTLANVYSIDASSMSKFVNGHRKITDQVLLGLHNFFFINKKYVTGDSNEMFDIPEILFHSLPLILKDISIGKNCEKKDESVLIARIDSRIYKCIINQRKIKNFSERESYKNVQVLINNCMKELKNSTPVYEEYFIIPRSSLEEIAHDNEKTKNDFCPLNLNELLSTILAPSADENECGDI